MSLLTETRMSAFWLLANIGVPLRSAGTNSQILVGRPQDRLSPTT